MAAFFGHGSQMAQDLIDIFDEGCDSVNEVRLKFNKSGLSGKDAPDYLVPTTNVGQAIKTNTDNALTNLLSVASTKNIDSLPTNLVTFLTNYDKVTGKTSALDLNAYNTGLASDVQKPDVYSVSVGAIKSYSDSIKSALADIVTKVETTEKSITVPFEFTPLLRAVYDDTFFRLLQSVAVNYDKFKSIFESDGTQTDVVKTVEQTNRRLLSTTKLGFKAHRSLAEVVITDYNLRFNQALSDFLIDLEVEINKFNDQLESEGISLEAILADFTSTNNRQLLENEQLKIEAIYAKHTGALRAFKTYVGGVMAYAKALSSMLGTANTALDVERKKLQVTEQKGAAITANVEAALAVEKINKQVNDLVFKDQEQITNVQKLEDDINKQLADYYLKVEEQEVDKILIGKKKELAEASAALVVAKVKAEMADAYLTLARQEVEKYKLEIDFEEAKAMYEASSVDWNGPLALAGATGLGKLLSENSIKLRTKKG
jgi:hypothetical protein